MNYHNTDVAACDNDYCKVRLTCLRWWIGTNKDPYQVYGEFSPKSDDGCGEYVYYEPTNTNKD